MKQRRNTKQRQLIFEAVRSHRDHPTAEEIYQEVSKKHPKISRGTVYRNLRLLIEDQAIGRANIPGVDRFDWLKKPHYHMLCIGCGSVHDVPMPYLSSLDQEIAAETGFDVILHNTVFEGYCPSCRDKKDSGLPPGEESE
ncbi:MAG: Fur family transcriptional regulator [Christensenellales bacterium]|jgi:Fur family ferric uptake transcriptional regulator